MFCALISLIELERVVDFSLFPPGIITCLDEVAVSKLLTFRAQTSFRFLIIAPS